jgi:hypothetical protein
MASLWAIHEPLNLRYDNALGFTASLAADWALNPLSPITPWESVIFSCDDQEPVRVGAYRIDAPNVSTLALLAGHLDAVDLCTTSLSRTVTSEQIEPMLGIYCIPAPHRLLHQRGLIWGKTLSR